MEHSIKHFNINHNFTAHLPADPVSHNMPRQVADACYSWVTPKATQKPKLLIHSPEVATMLDLNEEDCQSDMFTRVFSGNALLDGMKPYAMCYGGHQFGNWAGQLGDGRAMTIADIINQKGERWSLQLKGAGETPYSRRADGLAVLRSSVREFLCSEAMFHLGVPTTRALSLCTTGDDVWRDMFYDGNPEYEKGAVVCRVAPSFLRFGNYEIFAHRGDTDTLKTLLDFTITTYFPHLIQGDISTDTYSLWFAEVCKSTKEMIVHWQRVGFVHGVMNTDNMSILGLTIDYGPYGWLEDYNPDWTPNTTDAQHHRYAFGQQPYIAHWNLMKLASAIAPLFETVEPLQNILNQYAQDYKTAWQNMMAQKLGLQTFDETLVETLMNNLELVEIDMTIFFRKLSDIVAENSPEQCFAHVSHAFYNIDQRDDKVKHTWLDWFTAYLTNIQKDAAENRKQNMNQVNPKYVLRNYLAQLAIDKADRGDVSMLHELFEVLKKPYAEQVEFEYKYAQKRPDWAKKKAGCSMLSCSS